MQSHPEHMGVDTGFDVLDYAYALPPSLSSAPRMRAERELWCAVIAQAFFDMGALDVPISGRNRGLEPRKGRLSDEAAHWLLNNRRSFHLVCDLAGVNPHVIRRAAQIFYSRASLGAVQVREE